MRRLKRTNEYTFEEFLADTRADWGRIAKWLSGKWSLPRAVEVDDVRQELLLHAWRAMQTGDVQQSSFRAYVFWMAISGTKRWLNGQRSALRRSDRSPSRHDVVASFPAMLLRVDDMAADQEVVVDLTRYLEEVVCDPVGCALLESAGNTRIAALRVYGSDDDEAVGRVAAAAKKIARNARGHLATAP